ncbi:MULTISPECIES: 30S ribosome-binding factor RbfA [Tropicimonas]|uniref:Ribosome-binding factor A n=2 Tax=Tropicimonas TaxID=599652 RepID=A0A239INY8_9RHOB|nr:30S ribosome-binding factor RbfA [Tropicimonas sediminicola]SNS94124.1 ribosome-binding factor A [Tropicimonas sediminicola]
MAKNKFHTGAGPSQRQLRVGELIRRRLSEVLAQGDVHDPELNRMSITVAEVRTSPDLKIATAFVLPLGGDHAPEALEALNRNRSELRRMVAKGLALKYAPQLRFVLDDTFDRMDATRKMFSDDRVQRDIAASHEDDDAV